jgi:hypothetical protein
LTICHHGDVETTHLIHARGVADAASLARRCIRIVSRRRAGVAT